MKQYSLLVILLILITLSDFNLAQLDSSAVVHKEFLHDNYSGTLKRSFKTTPQKLEQVNLKEYFPDEVLKNYYTHYSKNYFKIDESGKSLWNGKYWSEDKFPLKVFVKRSLSEIYKNTFDQYIDYAFKIWEKADSRISFSYVLNEDDADIILNFEDNLINKYDENYLGITEYEINEQKEILKASVEIGLLKFNKKPARDGEIKSTIIHELGHALGLGHSDNEMDIMYPYINPKSSERLSFIELSYGDVEAIKSVLNLRDNP